MSLNMDENNNIIYQFDFMTMSEEEIRNALSLKSEDKIEWNKMGIMTINGKPVSSIPEEALTIMRKFYIENKEVSLSTTAKIFGVNINTLKKHARNQRWNDIKEGHTKMQKASGKTKLYYALKARKQEFMYEVLEELERILKVGKKEGKKNGKLFFNGKDMKEIVECYNMVMDAIVNCSNTDTGEEFTKVEAQGILEQVLGVSASDLEGAISEAKSKVIDREAIPLK